MSEKDNYQAGFGSDAAKDPRRIVFITKKTSAKVAGKVERQLMTYPHLVLRVAVVLQVLTIVLVVVALFWNAPLEQLANPLVTPNPAKAPWYFLGLQELLHYFPPIVAGILIPSLVVIALVVIPYFDVNVKGEALWAANRRRRLVTFLVVVTATLVFLSAFEAWDAAVPTLIIAGLALVGYVWPAAAARPAEFLRSRPLSWWVMTWFIAVAVTLTAVGTFFRGPGWAWVWPWR